MQAPKRAASGKRIGGPNRSQSSGRVRAKSKSNFSLSPEGREMFMPQVQCCAPDIPACTEARRPYRGKLGQGQEESPFATKFSYDQRCCVHQTIEEMEMHGHEVSSRTNKEVEHSSVRPIFVLRVTLPSKSNR